MPRLHRVVIPLAALLAVLPMLLRGPAFGISCGHDFDFHLLNWLEAGQQLAHGGWPRWAYTPGFNAGEPRFVFYPPLSWLLGSALTAVLPIHLVGIAYTWICLTLSGWTMHRLAEKFAGGPGAMLAAVLYLVNPYMLFTAYERAAFAELLAAAFVPLLLAAILAERPRVLPIAGAVALLWLSNAPAAVMGCYTLALLTVLRLAVVPRGTRLRLAFTSLCGVALGLALPGFYLVPAAYQRRFVQIDMAVIGGMTPADNFLFGHTSDAPHDAVLRTASVVACLLLAGTAGALAVGWRRRRSPLTAFSAQLPAVLAALVGTIGLLLLPVSRLAWAHLPELAFLQFPWRLLAILGAVFGLAIALALHGTARRGSMLAVMAVLLCAGLIAPAWLNFHQACDAEDAPEGRAALFHSSEGTEPTDEYTPKDADADQLHPHNPPYWLLPRGGGDEAPNAAAPAGARPGQAPDRLVLELPAPAFVVLNRRQYPAWQATVNGAVVAPYAPERDDGLLALALPAGHDVVRLRLLWTRDEAAGLGLSLAGLLVAGGIVVGGRRGMDRRTSTAKKTLQPLPSSF